MTSRPVEKKKMMKLQALPLSLSLRAGTALFLVLPVGAHQELHKLQPSDETSTYYFGQATSVKGGLALVGCIHNNSSGVDTGAAYLFDAASGQELFRVMASDGGNMDEFGHDVALEDGLALVGAPWNFTGHDYSGAAYLFDTTTGLELQKLVSLDPGGPDLFGSSVALSGDLALVGAPYHNDYGLDSGSVYLFDATSGQQRRKLIPADGAAGDLFGNSVSLDGGLALVGAYLDDDNGEDSGSAYLFDAVTGLELHKLTSSDGAPLDRFGCSVSLAGGLALVGSYRDDGNGTNAGAAYVFDVATGQQLLKLTPADAAVRDYFGCSVSLDGTTALVGAFSGVVDGVNSGSAYLFDATSGLELFKIAASDGAEDDHFGDSVSLDGDLALIGAWWDLDGPSSGSAYVFDVTEPGDRVGNGNAGCPCSNDNDGTNGVAGCANGVSSGGAYLYGSGSASVAANDLVLTVCDQEAGSTMLWFQASSVAATPPLLGDGLRIAVGPPLVRLGALTLGGTPGAPGCADTGGMSLVDQGGIVPGQSVCYQTWYRNPTGSPCGNLFNTSNGYVIHWQP